MRAKKKIICYCDRCGMFYNYYEGGKTFKDTENRKNNNSYNENY